MGNWKTDYIKSKFPPDKIPEMRDMYAKLLAEHNRDSEKAFVDPRMDDIFQYDVSAKLYAKNNWTFDNEIKSKVESYLTSNLKEILPTKEKIAKMLFETALEAITPREKILALKEYADLMGFTITESEIGGLTQNVILVTDNGSTLTWEEKAKLQQHKLKQRTEDLLNGNS